MCAHAQCARPTPVSMRQLGQKEPCFFLHRTHILHGITRVSAVSTELGREAVPQKEGRSLLPALELPQPACTAPGLSTQHRAPCSPASAAQRGSSPWPHSHESLLCQASSSCLPQMRQTGGESSTTPSFPLPSRGGFGQGPQRP